MAETGESDGGPKAPADPAPGEASAVPEAGTDPGPRRAAPSAVRGAGWRALHMMWALVLVTLVVAPNLRFEGVGKVPRKLTGWLRPISFAQNWRMYAPDAQRSQSYMNLTAHYPGGRSETLEETEQERHGWDVTWAGNKTRVDIWRHHANNKPTKHNVHRQWYLRAICIREARKGEVPTKITMHHIRRRFTHPNKVARGRPVLGRAKRRQIAEVFCKTRRLRAMIDADRAAHGLPPVAWEVP